MHHRIHGGMHKHLTGRGLGASSSKPQNVSGILLKRCAAGAIEGMERE